MKKHFTLIKLLVVTDIIAILAGMLLPVLNNAGSPAVSISFLNLERQYGAASSRYRGIKSGRSFSHGDPADDPHFVEIYKEGCNAGNYPLRIFNNR